MATDPSNSSSDETLNPSAAHVARLDSRPSDGPTPRRAISRRAAIGLAILVGAIPAFAIGAKVVLLGNVHSIVEGKAYRSGQPTAKMLERLAAEPGIRSVINLRGEWLTESWHREEKEACRRLGLAHYDIALRTHRLAPLSEVRKLIEAFDACPKPVLIHCQWGADRTSLAAALYVMLHEGQSLDESLGAYRLAYGHTGLAYGRHLPHLYDCYRDWLARRQRSHSPERFREWVASERVVGYFGAELTAIDPPTTTVIGMPTPLRFRARNVSHDSWALTTPPTNGIHLVAWTQTDGDEKIEVVAGGSATGRVAPGEEVDFKVAIPAFDVAGERLIQAEMRDEAGLKFAEFGVGRTSVRLNVLATGHASEDGVR